MPSTSKKFLLGAVCLGLTVSATSAFIITGASSDPPAPNPQVGTQPNIRAPRNMFLRPEALNVSRRLGNRFKPASRAVTTTAGSLTIEGGQQLVTIIRRQMETGETVELLLGSRGLMWSDREGVRAASGPATNTERLLTERLVLDSPDQFVLAQLRGASYFTVARNVRPTDASEDYNGPLWNLVRVDEPPQDESVRTLSTWRLYYINVQTGLPDRVEYPLNSQEIKAEILAWSEQNGEKAPAHMRWSSGGRIVMEYRAISISHNQ